MGLNSMNNAQWAEYFVALRENPEPAIDWSWWLRAAVYALILGGIVLTMLRCI